MIKSNIQWFTFHETQDRRISLKSRMSFSADFAGGCLWSWCLSHLRFGKLPAFCCCHLQLWWGRPGLHKHRLAVNYSVIHTQRKKMATISRIFEHFPPNSSHFQTLKTLLLKHFQGFRAPVWSLDIIVTTSYLQWLSLLCEFRFHRHFYAFICSFIHLIRMLIYSHCWSWSKVLMDTET